MGDGVGGHGFLDTLREHDLAKVLAEPTLVAISGRSASFRAGGEFPVLVAGAMGTNSIEYKPYGMEIDFVPRVLEDKRIRLDIRPRISEIDTQTKTKLGKHRVPSLNVRQVDTGVEMRAGQGARIPRGLNRRSLPRRCRKLLPWPFNTKLCFFWQS